MIDNKEKIHQFLQTQLHMVIATVSMDNNPEAAFVGFAEKDDLTVICGTSKLSRKYQNIEKNSHVALVFGGESGITVQYEGVAVVLEGKELEEYKQIYFAKNPQSRKYEHEPDQVYIKVTPSWIRYTDFNKEQKEIFEITF